MHRSIVGASVLLALAASASAKDSRNQKDYPLTAHVVSISGYSYLFGSQKQRFYTLRVGDSNYVVQNGWGQIHRLGKCLDHVSIGDDVHVNLQTKDGSSDGHINILTNKGEACTSVIWGRGEAFAK